MQISEDSDAKKLNTIDTRQFSNHESRLLSRSHTFAIIVISDLKIHQSMWNTLTLFSKNLNQRSLTPRWPLTPCLLRSHVWLYPRIIVSKSHDNTSMYVDTVINFAKYHIHTTYYILRTYYLHTTYRMSDHIVSYWTQFRRDNKWWLFDRSRHQIYYQDCKYRLISLLVVLMCWDSFCHFSNNLLQKVKGCLFIEGVFIKEYTV